mmetsp:Transcript_7198/g.14173  ORF Transcript_7198/g.14173 Transcript_7198/m.14173 type:complete len:208 (-) Transcript_7198:628-1251(-)
MGFFHTAWQPASMKWFSVSFPEHPMTMLLMPFLLMAMTTSVPSMTPPASSMYWSTTMMSNSCGVLAHIFRASSPFTASMTLLLGAMFLSSLRLSIVLFIVMSSMMRNLSDSLMVSVILTGLGCSEGSHIWKGIVTMQSVPAFTLGSETNLIVPPARSTRCFAMASPRPVPGAPPLCTKRLKSSFCWLRGIPGPVSLHANTQFPALSQ